MSPLFTPAARAQYSVSYSGGQVTGTGGGTTAYGPSNSTAYPGGWGASVGIAATTGPSPDARPRTVAPSNQTLNAGGTVTATVTSAPGTVLPATVVVEQVCVVAWSGGSGATGGCSNPLGGSNTPLSPAGASCTYISYTLTSSPNATYTCGPTANVSVPSGVSGAVTVEYRVDVYPVSVTLGGTTTYNNAQVALTGQPLSGTLVVSGSGFTGQVVTNSWVQPGNGFETYNTSLASNQLVPLSAGDLSQTTLSFYDGTQETLTLEDNVTIGPPSGVQGSTTSLGVSSVPVTVEKPTVTNWTITTGNVHYNSSANEYGLFPASGTGAPGGVWWTNVTVTLPPPFSTTGGTCCFTQLVDPNHQANGVGQGTNNNVNGLDNSFEYYGYTWSIGSMGMESDSPAITVNSGTNYGDTVKVSDGLQAWVMYMPPAKGSVWVPLSMYSYNWAITLTWTSPGTWFMSGQNPAPPNPGPTYNSQPTSQFPQWGVVQTNNE